MALCVTFRDMCEGKEEDAGKFGNNTTIHVTRKEASGTCSVLYCPVQYSPRSSKFQVPLLCDARGERPGTLSNHCPAWSHYRIAHNPTLPLSHTRSSHRLKMASSPALHCENENSAPFRGQIAEYMPRCLGLGRGISKETGGPSSVYSTITLHQLHPGAAICEKSLPPAHYSSAQKCVCIVHTNCAVRRTQGFFWAGGVATCSTEQKKGNRAWSQEHG